MTESTSTTAERPVEAQQMFGPRLKLERERRAITLKSIAESTKIKESVLAALERNDLSKWPQGIFRRAHFSDYVSAIGLPVAPLLAEFVALFPDESTPDFLKSADKIPSAPAEPPRVLDTRSRHVGRRSRLWSVAFDFAATLLLSSVAAALLKTDLLPTVAGVFLMYAAISAASFGETVGSRLSRTIERNDDRPAEPSAGGDGREPKLIVSARQLASRRHKTAA